MDKNVKIIIERFVNYLLPELTPYETSLRLYLLRNSFIAILSKPRTFPAFPSELYRACSISLLFGMFNSLAPFHLLIVLLPTLSISVILQAL